ncbi:uncharacterized protein LTR77_010593 [Saxophila tyrrhenica]|uniref:Uncharacterized protein n=1 Tax=Saxophila tyrrhenica TaxID=1690608 RepID=A0AAV9NYU7_9PEZI|nr:hypothetical protein LTR77_010593 [Saxophila tyrrhenica]
MANAAKDLSKQEEFASSEGGVQEAPASAQRGSTGDSSKMENELELDKANKGSLNSSDDVAGRKDKGTGTKVLEKMTGRAHEKEGEKGEAQEKGSGKFL